MDKKPIVVSGHRPIVTDLSCVIAHTEVGEHPTAGSYFGVSVEDVATNHKGNRHIMIKGDMRGVVDCLRFIGRHDHAQNLLQWNGIDASELPDVRLAS